MTSELNFARVIFMLLTVSLLTTNCKDMKLDIQDSKDRLDVLEGTTITSINEQIVAINTSISDLKEMDAALDGYIKTLEATAADLQKQIDGANAEITKVESELGEEISALEQSFLNELNTTKRAIEAELTAINATLVELKAADAALDKKIEDLQTYVDSQLASTTNWANATFSTLTQYAETQAEIATIKASIEQTNASLAALETRLNGKIADDIKTAIDALRSELNADYVSKIENAVTSVTSAYNSAISSAKEDLTTAYKAAIATAIAESEAGMKAWVNEQLAQGYYDIATMDGKLSALSLLISAGDTELQNQINEQKVALEAAKEDLTKGYMQYISQAITVGGIIDQAIATQVRAIQDNLQSQIDVINGEIYSLKNHLGKLEKDFVNRIQSLKYLPEYRDRVAIMSAFYKTVTVDFLINPKEQSASLEKAWNNNNDIVKAFLRYTKEPVTRTVAPIVPLDILSLSSNSDGIITVVLSENALNPLCEDFLSGNLSAVAYIQISDGNNDLTSDIVDIIADEVDYTNLSISNGTVIGANSYIVSEPGVYKFIATKGNSLEIISNAVSANVLWETFGTSEVPLVGDLIKGVKFRNGYVCFSTTNSFREGNAVLAVKNANGDILWSWHIWLTDNPKEQVCFNGAGVMMDRNLGATSATPGDVGSLGLLYQWGRKDPFLGSSSISSKVEARSTLNWPECVAAEATSDGVEFAISHPTTYITSNLSSSWFSTASLHDSKALWNSKKTIYDPCPLGWRVPDGGSNGFWKTALGALEDMSGGYSQIMKGVNASGYLGQDEQIWFPYAGYKDIRNGEFLSVGSQGFYSSCYSDGSSFCGLILHGEGNCASAMKGATITLSSAASVRCVKE